MKWATVGLFLVGAVAVPAALWSITVVVGAMFMGTGILITGLYGIPLVLVILGVFTLMWRRTRPLGSGLVASAALSAALAYYALGG